MNPSVERGRRLGRSAAVWSLDTEIIVSPFRQYSNGRANTSHWWCSALYVGHSIAGLMVDLPEHRGGRLCGNV